MQVFIIKIKISAFFFIFFFKIKIADAENYSLFKKMKLMKLMNKKSWAGADF